MKPATAVPNSSRFYVSQQIRSRLTLCDNDHSANLRVSLESPKIAAFRIGLTSSIKYKVHMKQEVDTIDAIPSKRLCLSIIADYDLNRSICELVDNGLDVWVRAGRKRQIRIEIIQAQLVRTLSPGGPRLGSTTPSAKISPCLNCLT
jgi:hypothetical protein